MGFCRLHWSDFPQDPCPRLFIYCKYEVLNEQINPHLSAQWWSLFLLCFFRQKVKWDVKLHLDTFRVTTAFIPPQKCDWHVAELRLASCPQENPVYEITRAFHEEWHYSTWHEDFILFHIWHAVCEPVVLTSCSGLWYRGGFLLFLPGLLRSSVRAVKCGLSGQFRPIGSSADKRQVSDISDDATEKIHSKHVKLS